jgi:low temperature requirement protein LtrA
VTGIWLAHPLLRRRRRPERAEFSGEHFIERCRLFLLIALGETVVTPGAALASAPIRITTLASGTLALAGTLCLWWLYFHAEPLALRHVADTEDRVHASRIGANGLLCMIAGLIVLAAGNALVIDHPSRQTTLALTLMLFAGPAMFLAARAWYQRTVFGAGAQPQAVTIGALAAAASAALVAPALAASVAVVAILAGLVLVEHLTHEHRLRPDESKTPD